MGYRLQCEAIVSHFGKQKVDALYSYFITLLYGLGSGEEMPYLWGLPPAQGLHME